MMLHRAVDDGERAQAEEVELDQARGLDVVLVELRDHAAALFVGVQRRELGELAKARSPRHRRACRRCA